jgi:hypothetical protein
MKKPKARTSETPSPPETLRQAWTFSARVNACLTIPFVISSLIFVILVGSAVQPDFWTLRSLVNLWGNAWMLLVVSCIAFAPISHTFYWLIGSVHAAGLLLNNQILITLPEMRLLWQKSVRFLAQSVAAALARRTSVLTELLVRQPQHSPKSKAPISLFGRAALLLAP